MTTTEMPKAPRYNIVGTIEGLKVHTNEKGSLATFKLVRDGKRAVSCRMFASQLSKFGDELVEGATKKLFGFFEKRAFTGTDGAEVKMNAYTAIWAGEPRVAGAETVTEAVAA